MNSTIGFLIWGLVSLGLIGLGIYLLVSSQQSKRDAENSLNWPSVTGLVTEVSVKVDGDQERGKFRFMPVVEFVYDVNGKIYDGDKINFGQGPIFDTQEAADKFLEGFPPGSEVEVYYDPNQPKKSVLKREVLGTKANLVSGLVLILVIIGLNCAFFYFARNILRMPIF